VSFLDGRISEVSRNATRKRPEEISW